MEVSFSHACILVKDIHEADKFYRDILDLKLTGEREAYRGTPGACRVALYQLGDVYLEVMSPTGPDSTILNRTLEKRGEGFHHFCFQVDEMDTVIRRCQAAGIRLVDSFGEVVKLGGTNAYTDPRVTNKTLVQFIPTGIPLWSL